MLMKGENRVARHPKSSRDASRISYGCIIHLANMLGRTDKQFQSGAVLKQTGQSFMMKKGFEQDYSRFNSKPDVNTFSSCGDGSDDNEGSKCTVDEDK